MAENLIDLPVDCRTFTADGKKFIVHQMVNVDAFQRMEEFHIEMETGHSAPDLVALLGKAYKFLQQNNPADAAVSIYNAINVGERVSARNYPLWLLELTLFVRPEGSDLSRWDEAEAVSWIEAWATEGISTSSLFFCHRRAVEAFSTAFAPNSPPTSNEQSDEKGGSKDSDPDRQTAIG